MQFDKEGKRIESEALKRSRARVAELDPAAGPTMADPRTNVRAIPTSFGPNGVPVGPAGDSDWAAAFPKYSAVGDEKLGSPWGTKPLGRPSTEADAFVPSDHATRWGGGASAPPPSSADMSMTSPTQPVRFTPPASLWPKPPNGTPEARAWMDANAKQSVDMYKPGGMSTLVSPFKPLPVQNYSVGANPAGASFSNKYGTGSVSYVPPKINAGYKWGQNSRAA